LKKFAKAEFNFLYLISLSNDKESSNLLIGKNIMENYSRTTALRISALQNENIPLCFRKKNKKACSIEFTISNDRLTQPQANNPQSVERQRPSLKNKIRHPEATQFSTKISATVEQDILLKGIAYSTNHIKTL